jgi:hypothetical protein
MVHPGIDGLRSTGMAGALVTVNVNPGLFCGPTPSLIDQFVIEGLTPEGKNKTTQGPVGQTLQGGPDFIVHGKFPNIPFFRMFSVSFFVHGGGYHHPVPLKVHPFPPESPGFPRARHLVKGEDKEGPTNRIGNVFQNTQLVFLFKPFYVRVANFDPREVWQPFNVPTPVGILKDFTQNPQDIGHGLWPQVHWQVISKILDHPFIDFPDIGIPEEGGHMVTDTGFDASQIAPG